MDFTALPMNSTLIAPAYMHAQIRKEIIEQKDGIVGLRILTLSQFLSSYIYKETCSVHTALFQVHKKIQPLLQELTTYQKIADSEPFLKECWNFLNDIAFWNITLDELPVMTPAQIELRRILELFQEIELPQQQKRSALETLKTFDLSSIYIIDSYTDFNDHHIINVLTSQNAHIITMEPALQNRFFFHAVNKRQELEACAQYIIREQQQADDIHITLCDSTNAALLQQIFERYQIPFTLLTSQHTSLLIKKFTALFQFVLYPDNEHLMTCFDTGMFAVKGLHALREYMRVFAHDFFAPFTHVREIDDAGNILEARTLKKLQELEEHAAAVQAELLPGIQKLRTSSIGESVVLIMNLVKDTITKPEDISTYQQVNDLLQELYPYLQDKADITFMLSFLEDITCSDTVKEFKGVLVHNLTQTLLPRKHHYVIGASQNSYPAFKPKKGIFDEPYHAHIQNYPSMENRYAHHLKQLDTMLVTCENIYVSYPLGTYEGKGQECALEIEQFMEKDAAAYPLHVNYTEIKNQDYIDADTAKKLFLRDGSLHGSISSLERYVKCPFSYFLRYGLSLQEPMKPGFPDSYAGTLSHFILETLTTTYGKRYAQQSMDTVDAILSKELAHLSQLFPAMQDALANVKERLFISMQQTLLTLKDFEEHSTLSPAHSEYPFTYDIQIGENLMLSLRGYIDRIDESSDFSCILDYKSSIKLLSEANVFAALQLQLLTYAMVIAKESGKDIMGAYYISLKNENIPCSAGSMSRRKPVTHNIHDETDFATARKKAQRFNGWSMHKDVACIDDDASHITGLRMNKDGVIKATRLYDLHTISAYMEKMYGMIAQRILRGDIACRPLEDACTYCVYHEICRFKGFYEEKKQLIEPEEELYQKGDDDNA